MPTTPNPPKSPPSEDTTRRAVNNYMKYSGMAFQMGAILLVGILGGRKLDQVLDTEPYLTVLFALLSIFAALYFSLKEFFVRPDKDDQ